MGRAEDEIRIDAEDALGATEGLEVRRVFSGWGFYRRGLACCSQPRGRVSFASALAEAITGYMKPLTESCWFEILAATRSRASGLQGSLLA